MGKKSFAVIGYPIGHTMSPFLHNRLMKLSGIEGTYTTMEIPPEQLLDSLPRLRSLDGFNVTIPHKQSILPLLYQADEKAKAFGSVNTVENHNGRLIGHTTDGDGFLHTIEDTGFSLQGHCLILGNGGVAQVFINEILRKSKSPHLTIALHRHQNELPLNDSDAVFSFHQRCDRIAETLSETCRKIGKENAVIDLCSFEELEGMVKSGKTFDLLINATSVGMYPHLAACPVSELVVCACNIVFDAIYNPLTTQLLHLAKKNGIPAVGGMGMLVWQAAAAQKIWTGKTFLSEQVTPIIKDAQNAMQRRFGNIILCGFMGCGKTTVGAIISNALNRKFIDMDSYIQKQSGKTISEIFAQDGEKAFRKMETKAVETLSRKEGLVIAAGGGCLLNPKNTELFRETGITILLDAPLALIEQRLKDDHSRPLLECENREDAMRILYEKRQPIYEEAADYVIPVKSTSEEAACLIMELLHAD
ncbi:MAG: shikimate kinase [Oscillospiraceae bacterium]|jgi:shikimate dehydrogenase